jgi:hypothetical protein
MTKFETWLPTVAAALAFITSLFNRHAIKKVHLIINSRLSQLLEERGKAEHAAGRREGIEHGRSKRE